MLSMQFIINPHTRSIRMCFEEKPYNSTFYITNESDILQYLNKDNAQKRNFSLTQNVWWPYGLSTMDNVTTAYFYPKKIWVYLNRSQSLCNWRGT